MHAALHGTARLSTFFVQIRRHIPKRMSAADLTALGFRSHSNGPFTETEVNTVRRLVEEYVTARVAGGADEVDIAELLPNEDEHWGDGATQATDLLAWLRLKLPNRRRGQIRRELRSIFPPSYLAASEPTIQQAVVDAAAEAAGDEGGGEEEDALRLGEEQEALQREEGAAAFVHDIDVGTSALGEEEAATQYPGTRRCSPTLFA